MVSSLFLLVYFWAGLFVSGVTAQFENDQLVRGLLVMLCWPAWLVWRAYVVFIKSR